VGVLEKGGESVGGIDLHGRRGFRLGE
jgi:hypothetical protein